MRKIIKISGKVCLKPYSISIVFMVIFLSSLNVFAGEDSSGADLLADLKNPFVSKMPKILNQVENITETIQERVTNRVDLAQDDFNQGTNLYQQDTYSDETFYEVEPEITHAVNVQPKFVRPNFEVLGIIWNEQSPMAIINNRIVSTGDLLESYAVKSIGRSQVVLHNKQHNDEFIIRIGDKIIPSSEDFTEDF